MKFILLTILVSVLINLPAQETSDAALIDGKEHHREHAHYSGPNDAAVLDGSPGFISLVLNNQTGLMTGFMMVYQHVISPQLASECAYELSCSNFSKNAIERFGWVKGLLLTTDRLMRCNELVAAQADPGTRDPETGKLKDPVELYGSE